MSRAPLALALLSVGCASGLGQASLAPYDQVGILVRNRSREILCEARIARAGSRSGDSLDPSEVIPPGGSRFFPLPAGDHSVQLLDCNGDVVLRRPDVHIGEQGIMLSFEER